MSYIHVHMYISFGSGRDTLLQKHISEPQRWPTCELKIMLTEFEKIKIVGSFGAFIFNFIPTGGFETF